MTLQPILTFRQMFGPGHAFSARPSPVLNTWLAQDPAILDSMTGSVLGFAGEMPVLCSRGSATDAGLALLRDSGLDVAAQLYRFADETDYLQQIRDLAADGWRIVTPFVHTLEELPASHWNVPPHVVCFLNNKGSLGELVPAAHLPNRIRVRRAQLAARLQPFPFVVKAVTDESTGGGADVLVCRSPEQFESVDRYFAKSEEVIVEEFLSFDRNLCLHYAVLPNGEVRSLGFAEQVSDGDGKYQGNWIESQATPEPEAVAIGQAIAEKGAALGYRGCLGIDLGFLDDGRMIVFDLNFRLNGSTGTMLLHRDIAARYGHPVGRFKGWNTARPYRHLIDVARRAMRQGWFMPLSSYDPVAGGRQQARPRMSGILLGGSRDEVLERERELASLLE